MKGSLLLIVLVAGTIILSKVVLENGLGILPEAAVRSWIEGAGPVGAATVVGLLAADLFLPVPSSLIMVVSGAAFGVFWGSLLAFAGSVGGEWIGFELVRRYGTRVSAKLAGADDIARLQRIFAKHGAAAIVVTRALPVVMETMSVVAGLSMMRRRTFLLASSLGTAPIVVVYAYAGMKSRETGSLLPAVVMLIAVAGCGWIWYRARLT